LSLSREARALLAAMRRGDGTVSRGALGCWSTPGDLHITDGQTVYALTAAGIAEYTEWSTRARVRIGTKARLVPRRRKAA